MRGEPVLGIGPRAYRHGAKVQLRSFFESGLLTRVIAIFLPGRELVMKTETSREGRRSMKALTGSALVRSLRGGSGPNGLRLRRQALVCCLTRHS